MSLWSRTSKPTAFPHAVLGADGWVHPVTNEELVTFKTKGTIPATPAIQNVTFYRGFKPDGDALTAIQTAYSTYDSLIFAVRFDAQVTVLGSPYMTVVINGVSRHAGYAAGSGTATLLFIYRLVAADAAAATGVTVSSPLQLNSGHIYKLGTTTACTITFTPPTLTAVSVASTVAGTATGVLSAATYKLSDSIALTLTFDRPITVTGTPRIPLDLNGSSIFLNYASGTGTTALVFSHSVLSSDNAGAGLVTLTPTISLNSGTLLDAGAVAPSLSFTPPVTTSVVVDGTVPAAPTVTGITNGHHYVTGNPISLTVTYGEAITVVGSPQIPVVINSTTRQAVYASGSGTTALIFTYSPVVGGDVATAGQFSISSPISLNSGTLKDAVGNNAILTFTPPTTTTVTVN